MSRPVQNWKYIALLALAPAFWAGNQVVGRGVSGDISPIALNFWRWSVAFAVISVVAAPGIRRSWPVIRANLGKLAVLALAGANMFQILIYWGLNHTTAINAVMLNSSLPVYMIAISWLLLRDRVTWLQVTGGVISFAGVLVIISNGSLEAIRNISFGFGDLIIVFAMPLWALYSVLIRRWPLPLPATHLIAVLAFLGVVFMMPLYAFDLLVLGNSFEPTGGTVIAIIYIGVFASVIGILFWNAGVGHVGANIASFMYHLLPAYGTILAIVFLGEALQTFHVVGLGLILGGVFLSTMTPPAGRNPQVGTGS